jgi:hypothetical protein
MKSELEIKPSEELAYWVGVVQTDGCLSQNRISLAVKDVSLPMIEKFTKISQNIFHIQNTIKQRSRNEVDVKFIRFSATKYLKYFKKLDIKFGDPPEPPSWIVQNSNFFGSYLAGVLDGDGCITITKSPYRRCLIRIISGEEQTILAKCIENILNCSTYFSHRKATKFFHNRKIRGSWVELGFTVSLKNYEFIKKFLLCNLAIVHKKEKLTNFIVDKYQIKENC